LECRLSQSLNVLREYRVEQANGAWSIQLIPNQKLDAADVFLETARSAVSRKTSKTQPTEIGISPDE
jgi:hypothetical protein